MLQSKPTSRLPHLPLDSGQICAAHPLANAVLRITSRLLMQHAVHAQHSGNEGHAGQHA